MLSYPEVRTRFDQYFEENLPFPNYPSALYDPCYYILEDSGKRIRPALCILAAQLFNGTVSEDVYKVAMSLELFHNFTLIHDDIMDHAPLRRGKPTLHHKYGITTGILSGDVMNIYSYKCLTDISVHLLKPILDLFNTTAIEVCEGQQLDMDYETKEDVSIADYLEMIRLKTSVLLACSLKSGAILAEMKNNYANLLYEVGINLGMAFQIQDDYLDTFGNIEHTGKQVGGDIASNKKTYLYLKAREIASEQQKIQLEQLKNRSDEAKISETIDIYRSMGIDNITEELINEYFNKVITGMDQIDISAENKKPLLDLIKILVLRKK